MYYLLRGLDDRVNIFNFEVDIRANLLCFLVRMLQFNLEAANVEDTVGESLTVPGSSQHGGGL